MSTGSPLRHDHVLPEQAAHREELIFQAQSKIHAVTGFDVQIEMADYKADMTGLYGAPPVVVAPLAELLVGPWKV